MTENGIKPEYVKKKQNDEMVEWLLEQQAKKEKVESNGV